MEVSLSHLPLGSPVCSPLPRSFWSKGQTLKPALGPSSQVPEVEDRPERPKAKTGHTRGSATGNWRLTPRNNLSPPTQPQAGHPVLPVEPADGRYSRRRLREAAGVGARWAPGARRGAPLSDLLSSLRARPPAEPPRRRRGGSRPRRRLGGAPGDRDPARGAPAGSPLGTPWSEGGKPPRRVGSAPQKPRFPGEGAKASSKTWRFHGLRRLLVALNKSANLFRPNLEIGVHELTQSI